MCVRPAVGKRAAVRNSLSLLVLLPVHPRAMSEVYDDDLDGVPLALDDLDGEPMAMGATSLALPMPTPTPQAALAYSGLAAPSSSIAPVAAAAAAAPMVVAASAVSAAKVALFDTGIPTRGLTPFQRRQAEAEEKKRRADADAATVYAQFLESFDAGSGASASSYSNAPGPVGARRGGGGGGGGSGAAGRGGGAGGGRVSSLLTHKAFVSGGVIGGDILAPTTLSSSSCSTAAACSAGAAATPAAAYLGYQGAPAQAPGAKLADPQTLRASLPSTSGPTHKAAPFAFQSSFSTAASSPAFAPTAAPSASAGGHHANAFSLGGGAGDDATDGSDAAPSAKKRKLDKKRNIDLFLEEMKQSAADKAAGIFPSSSRGDRRGGGGGGGGEDASDPSSTNLFVGNLPVGMTERELAAHFALFGDIASVKIMWPRPSLNHNQDPLSADKEKKHHSGFVSFMRREDAQVAV